jgi:hypothetical protein
VVLLAGLGLVAAGLSSCTTPGSRAVAARCARADVAIAVGEVAVGGGHFGAAITLTNHGPSACSLHGYPRAVALGPSGRRAPLAPTPRGPVGGLLPGLRRAPRVVLAPGGVASALVEGASSARCGTFTALALGLPGGGTGTVVPIELGRCARLEVHPLVAGDSGEQHAAGG